jgi:hypothetical protein
MRRPFYPIPITAIIIALLLSSVGAQARDSLGVFSGWAAFRDPAAPRCYAIATPRGGRDGDAFISIGTWPDAQVRGQVHVRLASPARAGTPMILAVGERRFRLTARGRDAWAANARADAAIVAAMRGSRWLGVAGTRAEGGRMALGWSLSGAASAIDAAALGCAQRA